MRDADGPLVVIIDDIDRLRPDEIRLLFQLVKANADFPNLVYLLLFQRDIVELAVGESGLPGEEFLEKVVQVAFDLPRIEAEKLQRQLFDGVNRLLAAEEVGKHFD